MGGKVWAIIKVNKFTTGISLVVLTNTYQQGKSQSRVNRVSLQVDGEIYAKCRTGRKFFRIIPFQEVWLEGTE